MLTQQQLAERLNYVTGSDASVICGHNKYKSKIKLWLEKTRREEPEDISDKGYIKIGNYFEDGIARWFSDESGLELEPKDSKMIIHLEHKWMAGNIDFKIKDKNYILECKSANKPGEEWGDGENIIPPMYLFQVAHYCEAGGFDGAYIAVYFKWTNEIRWYEYESNRKLQDQIVHLEYDFWHNHVLADVPPAPLTESDILELHQTTTSNPIVATDDIIDLIANLKASKEGKKIVEDIDQDLRDKLTIFMKDHDTLIDSSGVKLATWKLSKERETLDTQRFKKEQQDLYKQYVKIGKPSRTLRIDN